MIEDLLTFVSTALAERSDPEKAVQMAAYMKTDMPFYGVQKPARSPVFKAMVKRFPIPDRDTYEAAVSALWEQPHREEKYAALHLARSCRKFVGSPSLPFYERLIREGAWWDLVDEVAAHLVAPCQLRERDLVRPVMDGWIDDPDSLWIRRAAILSQLRHRERTDAEQLFGYCLKRAHETDFFIRKAIGWSLREYSYANAEAVREFLLSHREVLSPLSFREGAKQLVRVGLL